MVKTYVGVWAVWCVHKMHLSSELGILYSIQHECLCLNHEIIQCSLDSSHYVEVWRMY